MRSTDQMQLLSPAGPASLYSDRPEGGEELELLRVEADGAAESAGGVGDEGEGAEGGGTGHGGADSRAMLLVVGWASGWQNGVVPSILPFATAPYGGGWEYLAANTASMLVDPLASVIPLAYRASPAGVVRITLAWTALGVYSLVVALQSPRPLLIDSPALGGAVIVGTAVCRSAMLSYTKVMANYHLKCSSASPAETQQRLEHSGTMMQVGATVAAALFFYLVNVAGLFSDGGGGDWGGGSG